MRYIRCQILVLVAVLPVHLSLCTFLNCKFQWLRSGWNTGCLLALMTTLSEREKEKNNNNNYKLVSCFFFYTFQNINLKRKREYSWFCKNIKWRIYVRPQEPTILKIIHHILFNVFPGYFLLLLHHVITGYTVLITEYKSTSALRCDDGNCVILSEISTCSPPQLHVLHVDLSDFNPHRTHQLDEPLLAVHSARSHRTHVRHNTQVLSHSK